MKYFCGTGTVGTGAVEVQFGRMERHKSDVYHVGKHSRPTPRLAHVIFYLFIYLFKHIFDLLVTVRVSQEFLSLFAFP